MQPCICPPPKKKLVLMYDAFFGVNLERTFLNVGTQEHNLLKDSPGSLSSTVQEKVRFRTRVSDSSAFVFTHQK